MENPAGVRKQTSTNLATVPQDGRAVAFIICNYTCLLHERLIR
jgi:hypothetical protein